MHIVEAHHRYILRHPQPSLAQRPDRPDGRYIVESKERSELFAAGEKFPGGGVAGVVGGQIAFEARDELRSDAETGGGDGLADAVPAGVGV